MKNLYIDLIQVIASMDMYIYYFIEIYISCVAVFSLMIVYSKNNFNINEMAHIDKIYVVVKQTVDSLMCDYRM